MTNNKIVNVDPKNVFNDFAFVIVNLGYIPKILKLFTISFLKECVYLEDNYLNPIIILFFIIKYSLENDKYIKRCEI